MAKPGRGPFTAILFSFLFQAVLHKGAAQEPVVSQYLVTDDVSVVEGEKAIISCRGENKDNSVLQLLNPNRESLYIKDRRTVKDERFQLVNFTHNELRVSLSNVSLSDEGRYVCRLFDDPPQEAYAYITVLIPPDKPFIEVPDVVLREGNKAEMTCAAIRSKPAATIRWMKNDQELPGTAKVELTDDKMYTVTSHLSFNVTKEDDGVPIVCVVDHPAVKNFQAQRYLEVQYKPEVEIVVEFPQGLTREGENLKLTCKAKGQPKPWWVKWIKVKGKVPSHAIIIDGYLYIKNLNKSYNGNYRCVAANYVGKSYDDYILYVYNATTTTPKPINSTTTPKSTTAITSTTTPKSTTAITSTTTPKSTTAITSTTITTTTISDSEASLDSLARRLNYAIIGQAIAWVVFSILLLCLVLDLCFKRCKNTCFTNKAKGVDDAADADTAIFNAKRRRSHQLGRTDGAHLIEMEPLTLVSSLGHRAIVKVEVERI